MVTGHDTLPRPGAGARLPGRPRDERVSRAITEAALLQLSTVGYAKLSMESVALAAGVSRATIYRRFSDKADLVTAAVASKIELPQGPSLDPRADLISYLKEFDIRFAESCLEVLGHLIGTREDSHAMALHRERVIVPRSTYCKSLLEQARDQGLLRPDADLDLALQMVAGSVFYRRVSGTKSRPGWAERAVQVIFDAMGPGPVGSF